MKKVVANFCLISLFLILVISENLSAQKSQRMVLEEQFTNDDCGYCPAANSALLTLYNANKTKMAVICYHTSGPGPDPMNSANSTDNNWRSSYYSISGIPHSVLDGVSLSSTPTQSNINTNYAVASPFQIQIYHEVLNGEITVQMTITKTAATTGTLIAQIAVIETVMTYSTEPGTNGETSFINVFKKYLPDLNGTSLDNMNVGDSKIITKSWKYANIMNKTNLAAVGFVQNNATKAVFQSAMSSAMSNIPPGADFAASTIESCNGSVTFTDLSSYGTSWAWDFGDGNTSTQESPAHIYGANNTYTVSLTVTNNGIKGALTKANYVTVNMPAPPTVIGDSGYSGSALTLHASGNGTLNWFTVPTGGTSIFTGNTFVTPVLNTTMTYYVEDDIYDAVQNAAKTNKEASAGGYFNTAGGDARGIFFDVYKPLTINSVKIYVDSAGTRRIDITQGDGGPVVKTKVLSNLASGEQRVTLDFQMVPGINYLMKCKKLTGYKVDLWRDNANVTYPITLNGILSVTGTNAGSAGYYYFFYDWEVTGGPCAGVRTKVTANILTGINEYSSGISYKVYPNPNSGEFNLNVKLLKSDNIIATVFQPDGKIIYNEKQYVNKEINRRFDLNNSSKGLYFLRLITGDKVYIEKLIIE